MSNQKAPENKIQYMPIFMCLGVSVGMAIGAALGNIGVGMCLGVCLDSVQNKKSGKDPENEEKESSGL